jgi:hypothetical protein
MTKAVPSSYVDELDVDTMVERVSTQDGWRIYQRALQRRWDVEEEIRQIDTFIALYRKFATETTTAGSARKITGISQNMPSTQRLTTIEGDDLVVGVTQSDFVKFAKRLLLENGRPMGSKQLLSRFLAKGRRIGGAYELTNMTTKLWRARDQIIKVPGAGYWPVDVPCPAVNYEPPTTGP